MGTLTLYILEWAFGLMLMLAVYKLLLSGTTFHRFNRLILLGILTVSALIPTLRIEVESNPIAINDSRFAYHIERVDTLTLSGQGLVYVEESPHEGTSATTPFAAETNDYWPLLLVATYVCYLAFFFTAWVRSTLKMLRFLRRCRRHRIGRWIRLCVHHLPYGPFNWMNCIVLSEEEKRYGHNIAMLHELAHVRCLHFVDLIVVNLCALANPACWLLLRELKMVHEYEADTQVLARERINPIHYQLQLIRLSVGDEAYSLASTLNFDLKQRIAMMKRETSNPWRRACVFLLVPVAGIVALACGKGTADSHTGDDFCIEGAWIAKEVVYTEGTVDYWNYNNYRRYKFIHSDGTFCVTQIVADSLGKTYNMAHCMGTYEYREGRYIEHYTNGTSLDLQLSILGRDSCTTVYQGITERWVRATGLTPEQEHVIVSDIKRQLTPSDPDGKMNAALHAALKSNRR